MTELLRNANLGWVDYKSSGKMAALLLAILFFLWFTGKGKEQRSFLLYSTVTCICCILPVTAVVLMVYQTRFYDYQWIWSLVPMTAVMAYGLTLFLAGQWEKWEAGGWRKALPVTLVSLLAILLCGNLGGNVEERQQRNGEKEKAYAVAQMLSETWPGEDICLLAPQKILEYIREADGSIRLAYGRNVWDSSLNAYAYDMYEERVYDLAQWMDWVEQSTWVWMPETDREEMFATLKDRVQDAVEMGINCILLPMEVPAEMIEQMEAVLGIEAQALGNYFVFPLF